MFEIYIDGWFLSYNFFLKFDDFGISNDNRFGILVIVELYNLIIVISIFINILDNGILFCGIV